MDYRYDHHRIGPHISNPMPALYDLSQSFAYLTPRLPQVIEAPKLPQVSETYETNPEIVGYTIHELEIEAYVSVLKAFKIQSDLLSWGKEGLITDLRRELNVTDQEHRTFLTQINSDESIKMIRELQQGVFTAREMPSSIRYAPGFGPNSVNSAPRPNLKLPSDDVSTMQRNVAHSQPMPAPTPQPVLQNRDGFSSGDIPASYRRNTEKPTRIVIPRGKKSPESKKRGRVQPHPKNLNHVAEVQKVNNKSGIIQICATETVLSKVQNMVYGSKNPSPDQIEKAKSILMDQERAILEALGKLANVPDEDDSPRGYPDQQESTEKLNMVGKWVETSKNVFHQVDYTVGLQ